MNICSYRNMKKKNIVQNIQTKLLQNAEPVCPIENIKSNEQTNSKLTNTLTHEKESASSMKTKLISAVQVDEEKNSKQYSQSTKQQKEKNNNSFEIYLKNTQRDRMDEIKKENQRLVDTAKYGLKDFDKNYYLVREFRGAKIKHGKHVGDYMLYAEIKPKLENGDKTFYALKYASGWTLIDVESKKDVENIEVDIDIVTTPTWYTVNGYVGIIRKNPDHNIVNNTNQALYMHRYLLQLKYEREGKDWDAEQDGLSVDHINGIKNDNRLENLRLATQSLQNENRGKKAINSNAKYTRDPIIDDDIPVHAEKREEEDRGTYFVIVNHPIQKAIGGKCDCKEVNCNCLKESWCTSKNSEYNIYVKHRQMKLQYKIFEDMYDKYKQEPKNSDKKELIKKYNGMLIRTNIKIIQECMLAEEAKKNNINIKEIINANTKNKTHNSGQFKLKKKDDIIDELGNVINLPQYMEHLSKGETTNGGAICIINHPTQKLLSHRCDKIKNKIMSSVSKKYLPYDKYQQMVLQEKVLDALYNEYTKDMAINKIDYNKYNNMYREITINEAIIDPTKIPASEKLTFAKDMDEYKEKNISPYIVFCNTTVKDRGPYFTVTKHPAQTILGIKVIRSPATNTLKQDEKLKDIERYVNILDKVWEQYLNDRKENILMFDTVKYQKMFDDNKPEKIQTKRIGKPRKKRTRSDFAIIEDLDEESENEN